MNTSAGKTPNTLLPAAQKGPKTKKKRLKKETASQTLIRVREKEDMSTPNQQRSRYPRPLKATHSFTSSGEPATGLNNGAVSSGAALSQGSSSCCLPSPPSPGPRSDATGFLPSAGGGEAALNVSALSTPPASPSTRRDQFGEE